MAWNESRVSRDIEFNVYTLKGTEECLNEDVKIRWKLKTCESRAQYIKQWKGYRKSNLEFTARTLWNMAHYIEELKSYKKVNFKNVQ